KKKTAIISHEKHEKHEKKDKAANLSPRLQKQQSPQKAAIGVSTARASLKFSTLQTVLPVCGFILFPNAVALVAILDIRVASLLSFYWHKIRIFMEEQISIL
ncbi:MAG: hypothetical protein QMD09_13850, partial [Desulfatibacillaceae bacterium]|nr:hypothetical protein [Desulfatibacillaceae bacterium]